MLKLLIRLSSFKVIINNKYYHNTANSNQSIILILHYTIEIDGYILYNHIDINIIIKRSIMPKAINPVRKAIVKDSLLKGKSARESLKDAGYSNGHIRRSTKNRIVKDSIKEIERELDKKGMIKRAYNTLDNCLESKQNANKVQAAQAILRFTEGDKISTTITDTKKQDLLSRYSVNESN